MNDNINKEIITISPFKKLCMTIGQLPSSYVESMSYYETLVWLINYLQNTIIPTLNNNGEAVTELQGLFVELQNYVNTYFDNLDVQEEINTKLDEMVEDGTLEEIIGEYINDKVQFIFPKFEENQNSSDSNLILYKDKVILIDTSSSIYYGTLRNMLNSYSISHIDYLIITHYHGDHTGGIESLISESYVDSETTILMPPEVTNFGDSVTEAISHFKQVFENNNLTYSVPEENEILTIENDLKLKFYNCDPNYLDEHYVDYNATSTQILVTFKDTQCLYTGDALSATLNRMNTNNFIKGRVDLYKIEHHGINITTDEDFINKIAPIYAVQTSGCLDYYENKLCQCNTTKILYDNGTKIYPCNMQPNYIEFVSNGNCLTCKQGYEYDFGIGESDVTYYVDINASKTVIQDGSSTKPFSQIQQAIAKALTNSNNIVTINVANGSYYDSTDNTLKDSMTISNTNKYIRILGNSSDNTLVKINSVRLYNAKVLLKDLTVEMGHLTYPGIVCSETDLILDNVNIDQEDGVETKYNGLNITNNSNVIVNGCTISNASVAIRVERSFLNLNTITFGAGNETLLTKGNSSHIITNSLTFNTTAEKYAFFDNYKNVATPINLYHTKSTEKVNSITLNRNETNFDWIEIEYTDSGRYYHKSTGKIYSHHNTNIIGNIIHKTPSGKTRILSCNFKVNGTSVTIENQLKTEIENGVYPVIDATSDNLIRIENIIGGFDDSTSD